MNTAQLIPFPAMGTPQPQTKKAGTNMYSEKFIKGYVMSSRLYREEVFPFLSDAARNVYAELESRINGHNKESDFVSYSQLQGGVLPGSRKLSSKTITAGVKELLQLGVISVLESGKQGVKKYGINDISIADHFTKESTLQRKVVRDSTLPSKADHFTKESETTLPSKDTIDNKNSLEDDDKTQAKFQTQNRPLIFIEYHPMDRTAISFKELCTKYPAQIDFQDQAKASFPNHSPERIFENLKKMAQWSLDKSNHTPQKWMTLWLDTFMKNMPSDAELAAAEARKQQKSQNQTPKAEKPKRTSRFGHFLKPQQGEMRDV